ncbi:MAG: hypothetical protein ABFC96_02355 [Thermoguttaceae bacterium]
MNWLLLNLLGIVLGVVSLLGLLDVVFAMLGHGSGGKAVQPDIKRWHPVIAYLSGLAIALLVLAGLFGLTIIATQVKYPVAFAIAAILLAGLSGSMIVLVRFYRRRQK